MKRKDQRREDLEQERRIQVIQAQRHCLEEYCNSNEDKIMNVRQRMKYEKANEDRNDILFKGA